MLNDPEAAALHWAADSLSNGQPKLSENVIVALNGLAVAIKMA